MRKTWFGSLGWEDPLEKGKLPTPVFWPEEFHGIAKLDTTEQLSLHFQYNLGAVFEEGRWNRVMLV